MKTLALMLILLAATIAAAQPTPTAKQPKHHAAVRTLIGISKAPKFLSKETLHLVMFGTENVVDGTHLVLWSADKAFDAISIQGKVPVLDAVYGFVSVANTDTGKLDHWLERQEMDLFGSSN